MAHPGDICESCGSCIQVVNTFRTGSGNRVRYLGCRSCGHRPNQNKLVCRDEKSVAMTSFPKNNSFPKIEPKVQT